MKFNLGELEDLFYDIKNILEYFEGTKYQNRRFKLHLSNGEHINFSVTKESVPHLLGINTTYLQATGLFKTTNSYELLKELIDNAYRIDDSEKKGIINYDKLFSKFIVNKIEHFKENIKIDIDNVEFICKYNKEKTYVLCDEFKNFDYIIVKKLQNNKIGLLCLVRNQGYFAPISNQIFNNIEEAKDKLKELLKHQEITLISGIQTTNTYDDYSSNYYMNIEKKSKKIKKLQFYKENFDASIDVTHDLSYTFETLKMHKITRQDNNDQILKIEKCIKEGILIDTSSLDDYNLIKIANAFNDLLCSNILNENDSNKKTYSETIEELKNYKKQIIELSELIETLTVKNNELDEKVASLEFQNENYKDLESSIIKLLKPRMQ